MPEKTAFSIQKREYLHCWLEHVRNSKKNAHTSQTYILIPLNISELTTSKNFFATVWPPGGDIIAFAENWNFGLKFFFVNFYRLEMTSS